MRTAKWKIQVKVSSRNIEQIFLVVMIGVFGDVSSWYKYLINAYLRITFQILLHNFDILTETNQVVEKNKKNTRLKQEMVKLVWLDPYTRLPKDFTIHLI